MLDQIVCSHCGSSEFIDRGDMQICAYCRSLFRRKAPYNEESGATIDVMEDVKLLLEKCRKDPSRASRYAGLVLDIDPTNQDALQYL
ncbi:hypothetical protein [Bifidobacterium catulorum]|uniref:hypothetical protein n=1 Tax=Bifidobacterium catulorum TaxID=1630173 RepID=UPI0011B23DE2|nr:hypothetical protein [Bifidobacterium catulorum]